MYVLAGEVCLEIFSMEVVLRDFREDGISSLVKWRLEYRVAEAGLSIERPQAESRMQVNVSPGNSTPNSLNHCHSHHL